MENRSNSEWLHALATAGPGQAAALADLRQVILDGLPYAVQRPATQAETDFNAFGEDVAQDTLTRVLAHLSTFEGRSRFTTWVLKIAVRVAFTELRRRRWKDVSLDQLEADANGGQMLADPQAGPERAAEQASVAALVSRMLAEDLTERQRQALTAVMQGMPLEEVARRLGTERNALYKLLHDARLRLKGRLQREGLSAGEVLALFARK